MSDVLSSTVVDINDPSDQQVQMMEQERLVLQLKEMIREREMALAAKEAELRVLVSFGFSITFHCQSFELLIYFSKCCCTMK